MNIKMRQLILCVLWFMSSAACALPTEQAGVMTHAELIRVIMGLLFVLMLIGLLSWVVKRLHVVNLSSSKGFQSIATMTLGPKERITLLKVGARYLLMGIGAGSVTLIHDFGEQLPTGFDLEHKAGFAEILKSVVRKT